jgi:energy-coupling factor transport system ATP-binding protein
MQTPVLIFDEPTAGLDAREQEQLGQVIASLHQQGKTIVMISHDMDFLVENLDRFVLLRSGQIILDAPARDFFVQKAALEACGMISPQITRLSQYLKLPQLALSVEHFLDCLT